MSINKPTVKFIATYGLACWICAYMVMLSHRCPILFYFN